MKILCVILLCCCLFPVVNKSKMLSAGVADVVLKFLQSEMPPVQFKLLGTLRMLIDTQGRNFCISSSLKSSLQSISMQQCWHHSIGCEGFLNSDVHLLLVMSAQESAHTGQMVSYRLFLQIKRDLLDQSQSEIYFGLFGVFGTGLGDSRHQNNRVTVFLCALCCFSWSCRPAGNQWEAGGEASGVVWSQRSRRSDGRV